MRDEENQDAAGQDAEYTKTEEDTVQFAEESGGFVERFEDAQGYREFAFGGKIDSGNQVAFVGKLKFPGGLLLSR